MPQNRRRHPDPHIEEEAYYLIDGVEKIQIGEDQYSVEPGDVIYVERHVEHYFYDIEEDLVTLVVLVTPFNSLSRD